MLIVVLRAVVSPAKALIPAIRPLLSATLQDILHMVSRVFPHAEQDLKRKTVEGSVLLGLCSVHGHAFCHLIEQINSPFIPRQLQKRAHLD